MPPPRCTTTGLILHDLGRCVNAPRVSRTQRRDKFGQRYAQGVSDPVQRRNLGRDSPCLDLDDRLAMYPGRLRQTLDAPTPLPSQARNLDTEGAKIGYGGRHPSTVAEARSLHSNSNAPITVTAMREKSSRLKVAVGTLAVLSALALTGCSGDDGGEGGGGGGGDTWQGSTVQYRAAGTPSKVGTWSGDHGQLIVTCSGDRSAPTMTVESPDGDEAVVEPGDGGVMISVTGADGTTASGQSGDVQTTAGAEMDFLNTPREIRDADMSFTGKYTCQTQ